MLLALALGASSCNDLPALPSDDQPGAILCSGFGEPQGVVAYALPQLSGAVGAWIGRLDAEDVQRGLALRQRARIQIYQDNNIQAATWPGAGSAPAIYLSTALVRRASKAQAEWFISHELGHHVVGGRGGHAAEVACDLFGVALLAAQGVPRAAEVAASALQLTGHDGESRTHPATGDRVAVLRRYAPDAIAAANGASGRETRQPRSVPAYEPRPVSRYSPRYAPTEDCEPQPECPTQYTYLRRRQRWARTH